MPDSRPLIILIFGEEYRLCKLFLNRFKCHFQ
jgi:hypothetical protein